jgi:hypothetical protein
VKLPSQFVAQVASLLEELGVPYHVGGSFASSAHGMFRASADVDFVIDPSHEQLDALASMLGRHFYLSREAMIAALEHKGTFNAIDPETSFKIDFFIKGAHPFEDEEMRRAIRQELGSGEGHSALIKSAEDTILRKLAWYRRGGDVSDRQWQDVVSILAASRGALDEVHLDRWSVQLGVDDLLARARAESGDL